MQYCGWFIGSVVDVLHLVGCAHFGHHLFDGHVEEYVADAFFYFDFKVHKVLCFR